MAEAGRNDLVDTFVGRPALSIFNHLSIQTLLQSAGVKAHFRMDESGLIQLEKVESIFEKTVNEEEAPSKAEDPSTLEQIKNAFNNK